MDFWSLPGPSSFVDDVEGAVRDGVNVVARFPGGVPDGLERDLRERLHSVFEWTSIDASRDRSDPVGFLRQQVCPDVSSFEIRNVAELAVMESFQGRLFWLENIDGTAWPYWAEALSSYSDACRNVDLLSRSVFVVVLSDEAAVNELRREVALVCRDFRDDVDTSDLFAFALWKARSSVACREHRLLLAHTVAQVAQWDSFLAEELLAVPLVEALNPCSILKRYARRRGWTPETSRTWETGTVDGPVQQPIVHSALLEVSGSSRVVRQRLWAAQAAVLLPLVEQRRVGLVERQSRYIRVPIENGGGQQIEDPLDLDLGMLAWHLDRVEVPQRLRARTQRLRRVRNKLAHMEPLTPEEALHPMLFGDE